MHKRIPWLVFLFLFSAGDFSGSTVFAGDSIRVITTVAGNGNVCEDSTSLCGDRGSAISAQLANPWGVAAGNDGTLYIADTDTNRIRRVTADGIINTVVGSGAACLDPTTPCGDGGWAIEAQVNNPTSVAIGPDGSLYIADGGTYRVRRVSPNGIITTVAGSGKPCLDDTSPCGDGGPATEARLEWPRTVAIGADGMLYIADGGNNVARIWRVGLDGIIKAVVGAGPRGYGCVSPVPATEARLNFPHSIVFGPDGSLFIGDGNHRVCKVALDGIVSPFAGNGNYCKDTTTACGDGGPAVNALLNSPGAVGLGSDGVLYIVEHTGNKVRAVDRNGIITTFAGTGKNCPDPTSPCGDLGNALEAQLNYPIGGAVVPNESLYIADTYSSRIRRVELPKRSLKKAMPWNPLLLLDK